MVGIQPMVIREEIGILVQDGVSKTLNTVNEALYTKYTASLNYKMLVAFLLFFSLA